MKFFEIYNEFMKRYYKDGIERIRFIDKKIEKFGYEIEKSKDIESVNFIKLYIISREKGEVELIKSTELLDVVFDVYNLIRYDYFEIVDEFIEKNKFEVCSKEMTLKEVVYQIKNFGKEPFFVRKGNYKKNYFSDYFFRLQKNNDICLICKKTGKSAQSDLRHIFSIEDAIAEDWVLVKEV